MKAFIVSILMVSSIYSITASAEANRSTEEKSVALRYAPINSSKQLESYLLRLTPDSPLAAFSASGRERFVAGLRFGSNGLGGYDYEPLTSELTASQAYRVLSLFGAQRTLSLLPNLKIETAADQSVIAFSDVGIAIDINPVIDDHVGYACYGRATCIESSRSICMSSC